MGLFKKRKPVKAIAGSASPVSAVVGKLARRKLLILSIVFLVVSAGMGVTLLITPKYEANMSILVSKDRVDPQITSSDKAVDVQQTAITDEEFNSELELFKSIEVVTGVVKDLDLVHNTAPRKQSWLDETRLKIKDRVLNFSKKKNGPVPVEDAGDNFSIERAANRVIGNLDVVPIKKSRVIKITYTDTDPLRAKKTLEAIYQKYVELHVQLNEKSEAAQVFSEQTGKYNQKLNAATETLKNFDESNGISGADISTQQGLLMKQLSDTQAQADSTKTEIAETQKKVDTLQEKIASEPKELQTGYVSRYVQALDKMKEELTQLEQQRTQLLQKYQPNSRFVKDNQERIDQIKRSIAQETANPPQEKSFAINDLRRKLEAELYEAQATLASLQERQKGLNAQAAKLNAQVALINSKSIERTGLERQKNVNEEAYLLYQKKARENEIGQVLNKEKILNFGVIDPPRTDGQAKNPKPILNLIVLLGLGVLSAFAAALVLDRATAPAFRHDVISTARQIELRYDLPVLANIPKFELTTEAESIRPRHRGLLPAFPGRSLSSDIEE